MLTENKHITLSALNDISSCFLALPSSKIYIFAHLLLIIRIKMTTRRLAMTCWLVGVFSCTWGSASFTSLIRRHNFVGIHIFHSGKPRRNFLIQISSKIYLTLKEKGSEARKVCMIRYFSFPRWKPTKRRRSSSSVQFFMILVSSGRRHDLLRVRYYMII